MKIALHALTLTIAVLMLSSHTTLTRSKSSIIVTGKAHNMDSKQPVSSHTIPPNILNEIITAWQEYIRTINWPGAIKHVKPKVTGCGLVYCLANPFERRLNESFAIADMSNLRFSEPHYHPEETEIYFILQGEGLVVVGEREELVRAGSIVVIPPNTAHFTIPHNSLVLAVVNTPPFRAEHYIPLIEENKQVKFNKAQFLHLTGCP
jgi:mannose-6-phosphate isomerase-like protein (cupin superfamily)